MRPLHSSFISTLLVICTALVSAQQTQPPATDTIGPVSHIVAPANYTPAEETYVYSAEWRIWNAGTVTLGVSREGAEQRITATAESQGVVSMLFPVHNRFQALYDPHTFCSISLHKHSEEGFHKRDTLISYVYSRKKAVLDETNLKTNATKHEEHDIPGCVTDVISGVIYVRSMPLIVGTTYTFPLNDGGKTADVSVKVEAKESVKVPAGTFSTMRVAPESANGPLKTKGKAWIWYSDDARHIPVQLRAKAFWGTITLKLVRIESAKK